MTTPSAIGSGDTRGSTAGSNCHAYAGLTPIAGLASSRATNEDCYAMARMMRAAVGTNNIEVCTNVSCAVCGAKDVVDAFEKELGIHAGIHHAVRGMEDKDAPADGVITGYGTVHGRTTYVFAQGFTVFGLKYRTHYGTNNVVADALADAKRAVRLVRHRAPESLGQFLPVDAHRYLRQSDVGLSDGLLDQVHGEG